MLKLSSKLREMRSNLSLGVSGGEYGGVTGGVFVASLGGSVKFFLSQNFDSFLEKPRIPKITAR